MTLVSTAAPPIEVDKQPQKLDLSEGLASYLTPPSRSRVLNYFRRIFGIGQTDWVRVLEEVDRRRIVFSLHREGLDIGKASHEIAAVDIFVEKAQLYLEQKSRQSGTLALISMIGLCAVIACDAIYLIWIATIPQFFETLNAQPSVPHFDGYLLTMWVLRGSALSVLSGAAIYFLASLTRAFLHEATVLWNRRHSLRLGRLFIYLKFAGIDDPTVLSQVRKSLKIEEIEKAFGWNLETSSAFRDIKPEVMAIKGAFGDPAKVIEAAAKLMKSRKEEKHETT